MSDHHHHHHGDHDHTHGSAGGELTETQKVLKRLHHWIHHNDDHAASYLDWAARVETLGFAAAAERLRKAADLTQAISREFEAAAAAVREQSEET